MNQIKKNIFFALAQQILNINKRQKIIITCASVTLIFLLTTQTINIIYRRYYLIVLLGGVTYLTSLWSLREGMTKLKAVILLILPTLYVISFTGFYFLFREIRWLTRLPAAIFLFLSFYLLMLSQNVFNVSSIRSIPLYRAATSTSFIFTIATSVFLYSVIFTLNLPFYWNGLAVLVISFPLFLQTLWSIGMDTINSRLILYSLVMSIIVGETALVMSFWPVSPVERSLLITPIIYSMMGIIDEYMKEKLSRIAIYEYIGVGLGIFLFIYLVTSLKY